MPISPFQQPSFRRNALASLLREADRRGDTRQLLLLKSQWVHRYGVDSMPTATEVSEPIADLATEQPLITDQPLPAQQAPEVPAIDEPVLDELTIEDLQQEEPQPEEQASADLVAACQEPVAADPSAADPSPEPMSSRPFEPVRSIPAAVSIPAPPISTPRSLRRWLPGADDQLPKAS